MKPSNTYSFFPLNQLLTNTFPIEFNQVLTQVLEPLDNLNFIDVILEKTNNGLELSTILAIPKEFKFKIFGENGFMVSFSNDTLIVYGSISSRTVKLKISTTIKLQIPPSLLKPISTSVEEYVILEFPIDFILEWNETSTFLFEVETIQGFSLKQAMIGNTGFVVSVEDLRFNVFADLPPEEYEFSLKEASIITPQFLSPIKEDTNSLTMVFPTLSLFDTTINSNGFSGIVSAYWDLQYAEQEENSDIKPFYYYDINKEKPIEKQPLAEFLGISGGFEYISLTFVDNELVDSKIIGKLLIPYFDEPVEIELNIITGNDKLDFTIILKSEKEEGIELKKDELMALYMKSLSISKEDNSVALTVDGGIQPLLWNTDGLDWPRLDVEGLGIEQDFTLIDGKLKAPQIKFKEAWGDLKELATLDLFGFHFELNKIGMGYIEANIETDEVDKSDQMWLEFTGSLKLMEQLPMGVAVEGFRLTWNTNLYDGVTSLQGLIDASSKIEVKFDGVHLSHSIPHTIEFDGFIKFIKESQNVEFAGGMELRIPSTGLAIESNLLIGMNFKEPAYPYLYVQFGIELPAGIPLAQSGLALKGAEGLLGMNVEPAVEEGQTYYDWYKSEPEGMTSAMKWRDKRNSFAFGAGVTITTIDGKTFGMQGLFALVLPGPIIMLEGKALIFDGIFPKSGAPKATAFFNGKEKNVQFNIETSMQFGGGVVDVNANIEAFFDFDNKSNWHLYIGKDVPAKRRIHANVLNIPNRGWLFEGNTYLMLSNNKANMGMHIGFEPPLKDLKVASVKMHATLEGKGDLTINPFQFNGEIKLDALLDVKAFDILETTISAYAEVKTKGVTPLTVDATIVCEIELPVPDLESIPVVGDMLSWFEEEVAELPDIPSYIKFTVPFHWEHIEAPTVNPLIQDISVNSHFDQGEYTDDKDNPYKVKGGSIIGSIKPEDSIIVPLDGKPNIVFDQNMNQSNDMKFGGFLDNGKNIFSAGDIAFTPTITQIKVFKIKKNELSNNNWIEDENVWGLFRPENDLYNDYVPSRRVLQLWSNNLFEFVNGMVLNNETHSYVQKFIEHNDTFKFTPKERISIEEECIDTKKYQSEIVKIDNSYYRQLIIQEVIFKGTNISINKRGAIKVETFLNQKGATFDKSSLIQIHFPKKVVKLKITFLENAFKNFRLYGDSQTTLSTNKDCSLNLGHFSTIPNLIVHSRNSSAISSSSSLKNYELKINEEWKFISDKTIEINYKEGFNCMEIEAKSMTNISSLCWITEEEEKKEKYWDSLINLNEKIIDKKEEKILDTDSYYKIEVKYTITSEDKEFYYNDGNTKKVDTSKTVFFQTSNPSTNLKPYIHKVLPSHEYQTFFYNDDIAIHFNRSYMQKLYSADTPYELTLSIEDSSGKEISSHKGEWKKNTSSFLLVQEEEWYKHIEQNDTPKDDVLLFKNLSLEKQSRYNLKIKMGEKEVYSSRFMTSQFSSYRELLFSYKEEEVLKLTTNLELKNLESLENSKNHMLASKNRYEIHQNKYSKKAVNKENVEISKQKMIAYRAEHNEKFLDFLLSMEDIAYKKLPRKLEIHKVLREDKTIGFLLRSPESLDTTSGKTTLIIDTFQTSCITNGDGTIVFVYRTDKDVLERRMNTLNFEIDDELDDIKIRIK